MEYSCSKRPVVKINEFADQQRAVGIAGVFDTELQITSANVEGESGDRMILQ